MDHDSRDRAVNLSPDTNQRAGLQDQWIRARALESAVAYHARRGPMDETTYVMDTADQFAKYIRDGVK